jgi:hypothetical protein
MNAHIFLSIYSIQRLKFPHISDHNLSVPYLQVWPRPYGYTIAVTVAILFFHSKSVHESQDKL